MGYLVWVLLSNQLCQDQREQSSRFHSVDQSQRGLGLLGFCIPYCRLMEGEEVVICILITSLTVLMLLAPSHTLL